LEYDTSFARSHSYEWQRIKSQPIPFAIGGIPFVLQIEVPVELGYEVDIRVASRMYASAGARGSVTYGVRKFLAIVHSTRSIHSLTHIIQRLDYVDGGLKPLAQGSWQKSGKLSKIAVQENGDAEVYILPQMVLLVDKIGGPTAGAIDHQCSGVIVAKCSDRLASGVVGVSRFGDEELSVGHRCARRVWFAGGGRRYDRYSRRFGQADQQDLGPAHPLLSTISDSRRLRQGSPRLQLPPRCLSHANLSKFTLCCSLM
jgi:hypothetical protein